MPALSALTALEPRACGPGHTSAERHPARALPRIDPARCTGCGWCVAACAPRVLALAAPADAGGRKHSALHTPDGCTGCALCALRCPFGAIAMQRQMAHCGDPV